MVDSSADLILHCEVSTLLHVAFSVHFLVALGPNPNDGFMSLQNTSDVSLTLVIGHNTA